MNNFEKAIQVLRDLKDSDFKDLPIYTYADMEAMRKKARERNYFLAIYLVSFGMAIGVLIISIVEKISK